ncbi:protein chromatin remodeling 20 [Cladorrhinum sp. PSN332]|nr:protein chromatin remodeling 20 [Cladorrhinum sp. PSN332]
MDVDSEMAESGPNDPFNWDEERLLQEFCTPNRTWNPPAGLRFPEPSALRAKLVECGIDGNSLLTCTEEYDYKELWENLGIKKLPHQVFLKKVIPALQDASPAYQQRKLELGFGTANAGDNQDDGGPPIKSELRRQADSEPSSSIRVGGAAIEPETQNSNRQPVPVASGSAAHPPIISQGVISPALSSSTLPEQPIIQSVEQPSLEQLPHLGRPAISEPPAVLEQSSAAGQSAEAECSVGESPSKRRVAPITISAGPVHAVPSFVPTEGDRFLAGTVEGILASSDSSGFLGSATLVPDRIIEPVLTTCTEEINLEFSQGFKAIPSGRRLQVWKAMKQYLRADRLAIDMVPEDDDDESLLPLLDSDEEFDEETKREMEKDRLEDEAMKERMDSSKKHLTKEEVDEIVNNAIQELEARWHAEKKPKHERKAYKLWRDARRNPFREPYMQSLKKRRTELDIRLSGMMEKFTASDWLRNESLKKQAPEFLEITVFDRLYQYWLIDVLENPREPAKPSALPRPTPLAKKQRDLDEDEEVLSSDSEDDVDGFIDYSDRADLLINDAMDHDDPVDNDAMDIDLPDAPVTALDDENPMVIKVENGLVSANSQNPDRSEIIELPSSPAKSYQRLDEADLPGLDTMEDFERIADIGADYWAWAGDSVRLVVAALMDSTPARRSKVFEAVNSKDSNEEVWEEHIQPVLDRIQVKRDGVPQTTSSAHRLAQIFDVYTRKSTSRLETKLGFLTWTKIKRFTHRFSPFCDLIRRVSPVFADPPPSPSLVETPRKQKLPRIKVVGTPSKQPTSQNEEPSQNTGGEGGAKEKSAAVEEAEAAPESQDPADVDGLSDDDSSNGELGTPAKKRRRRKVVNQEAKKMRIATLEQNKEFDRRRQRLQQNLATGIVPSNKTRLIVNETKEEGQPLIFINDHIGGRIKDHQIDGVRFMWNHVVVNSSVRQGCLLAHTMGLGKTMQVITLLVVIAEASASENPSIRDQIPESLRASKTLILCPAGLVENWFDELCIWAPENALGELLIIDSTVSEEERAQIVEHWASRGGVLIIGYHMFTGICLKSEGLGKLLQETPNLVVADEAHYIKNQVSQRAQAAANFSTPSLIALTGSPLTNNVSDYYAMINWVAPNYLGPLPEFNATFANPIKEGLYADSNPSDKRKARRLLHVLKETVGPKMHRKDADVLHNALPAKKEFIITLPLTDLQQRLYEAYIHCAMDARVLGTMTTQVRVWSLVAKLGLVLAHPKIFKSVAELKKSGDNPKGAKGKTEDEIDLPQDLLSELLKEVAGRDIDNTEHSYKILALLQILSECRKVGDKVLVFSQSIPTLDYLESLFRSQELGYQRLDGKTPIADRQGDTKKFNTDKHVEVYLISTKAGGVGLNIYGANRVVIFDFKYTPTDEQQAIGRAYRLGQTKPVYVYWLFIGGTFEEIIHNNAIFKTQLASRVVDKKNPTPWSTRLKEYFAPPRIPEHEDLTKASGQDIVLDALLKSEEVGKEICKITSTETFEKEETFELTTDEQRDAEQEIRMWQLRTHDPDEYHRQMAAQIAARRRIDQASALPPVYQAIQAAPTFPSAFQPTPAGVPPPQATLASLIPALPGFRPGIPSRSPTQTTAGIPLRSLAIQPIMGAGTFIRETPTQAPPLSAPSPPATSAPPATSTPTAFSPPPATFATPLNTVVLRSTSTTRSAPASCDTPMPKDFEHLSMVSESLKYQGYPVTQSPEEVARAITSHLEHLYPTGLPLSVVDQLQHFIGISKKQRFAEALLSGYIKPQAVTEMKRQELVRMSTHFDAMEEATFRQTVWVRPQSLPPLMRN